MNESIVEEIDFWIYKLNEYSETDKMIKLFNDSKKKDDLSDCYLQAITYLMFEKLIFLVVEIIKFIV